MPRKPRPDTGVVTHASPLKIVSQRQRYAGEATDPAASFALGDVVDFEPDGKRARAVRGYSYQGTVVFSGLRDWAPGRLGIVTQVQAAPESGATIVDLPSGQLVSRERDDGLKVGDLVAYDLMSDFVALELTRIQPKKKR